MYEDDFIEADREYRRYMSNHQRQLDRRITESSVLTCDSKKSFTLTRYRQAKENQNILPAVNCRPNTAPGGKYEPILGYTGYRPRTSIPYMERPVSPLKVKIFGYSGHIPHSVTEQHEILASAQRPVCKYASPYSKRIPTPQEKEQTKLRYERNMAILEKRGQTAEGVLNIVQNKLQERVTSSAQQLIRLSRMFEYFDFDGSHTLEENEFRKFLEYVTCFLDDVQFLALFALFDMDYSSGLCWEEFKRHAMVPNPRGGTAILPKAIINSYGDPKVRSVKGIKLSN